MQATRCVQHGTLAVSRPFTRNVARAAVVPFRAGPVVRARQQQHRQLRLTVCNSDRKRSSSSSNGSYKKVTTIRFQDTELKLPTDNLWQLAIPAAAFIAVSAVLGPVVIGLAISAVAIGAAFTAGTFAFAFPFLFLMFFFPLLFGGITFTSFVTLGFLTVIPKLVTLAVAGAGLAIGWGAVNLLRLGTGGSSSSTTSSTSSSSRATVIDVEPEETEEERIARELKEEQRRRVQELRDFDDLLEGRQPGQRADRWRP